MRRDASQIGQFAGWCSGQREGSRRSEFWRAARLALTLAAAASTIRRPKLRSCSRLQRRSHTLCDVDTWPRVRARNTKASNPAPLDRRTASDFHRTWSTSVGRYLNGACCSRLWEHWQWAAICTSGSMTRSGGRSSGGSPTPTRISTCMSAVPGSIPIGASRSTISVLRRKRPTARQPNRVSIDEMYLAGNLRIDQLVTNQMQIDDIVVRRAHLRLARHDDGRWNTAELLPLPHFSDQSPRITIEDASGTVQYSAEPGAKPMSLQGVNLKLMPVAVEH